tara:strand:- start:1084 stop:1233 length:150 start_codon:yes stop_codon:yes gene_type:complete
MTAAVRNFVLDKLLASLFVRRLDDPPIRKFDIIPKITKNRRILSPSIEN